jgi:hypothetical protein|tara:strand:- start:292 stop:1212 length:921 start_codon:yes stop_codon:yes gene_type:complete
MSLENRIKGFDNLGTRFEHRRVGSLLVAHRIRPDLFERLQMAAALYISRSLKGDRFVRHESALMYALDMEYSDIRNITPNGMIVPKNYNTLEYNMLVRAFSSIIESLGITDLISSWHIPLNLRYKQGKVNEENMLRHHPTEHIHSDSWAGESSESVTVHIPIFGDTDRNYVSFYEPPSDFDESWLGALPSYKDGEEIAQRYTKLGYVPRKGDVHLADFAGLHASTRVPGAKSRITIDTTFVLKRPGDNRSPEKIHHWRENERASPHMLSNLGKEKLFYFPDGDDSFVDSEGGFKHPSNLHIMNLEV